MDEWFISVKLNCLIPGNDKIEPITALNSLCGQLLTFSFVIQAENAMKCYIMHNGQTMRFQGPSSGKLLSYLFKENNYEQYVDEKMKEFDHLMKDEKFEEFYAQMNNGYEGDA